MNPNEPQTPPTQPQADYVPQPPVPEQPIPAEQPTAPQPPVPEQPVQPEPVSEPVVNPVQAPVSNQPQVTTESVAPQPQPVAGPTQPNTPQPTPASNGNGSSKMAVIALILGIVAVVTSFIGLGLLVAIAGIVVSIIALAKKKPGKGKAIAGLILSALAIILSAVFIFVLMAIAGNLASKDNYETAYGIGEYAQAYRSNAGVYPTYSQLIQDASGKVSDESLKALHEGDTASVSAAKPFAYEGCSTGATVSYWRGLQGNKSFTVGSPEQC